ncbi:MAG TPA: hypothetical protein VKE40_23050 [Gemmataceae bacterium]|nr:hypothetical protein [Gemmataceae bacterium]
MSIRAGLIAALLVAASAGDALAQVGPQGPRQNQNQQGRDAGARAGAAGALLCIGFAVLIGLGVKIAIIWFIISDARKRGMDPTVWVLIEIFVGLIGLIIYLCVREPLLSERRRRRRRDDEYDEDDDDRPRRSRRLRDDEDEDDRPRRRRDDEY